MLTVGYGSGLGGHVAILCRPGEAKHWILETRGINVSNPFNCGEMAVPMSFGVRRTFYRGEYWGTLTIPMIQRRSSAPNLNTAISVPPPTRTTAFNNKIDDVGRIKVRARCP